VKVLDSLWAHKGDRRVGELLEARGCELAVPSGVLLPGLLAHRGGLLQAQGAALRKEEALVVEALGRALDAVSGRDARGFFDHCGHPLRGQLP
jgi:hypothetical protein